GCPWRGDRGIPLSALCGHHSRSHRTMWTRRPILFERGYDNPRRFAAPLPIARRLLEHRPSSPSRAPEAFNMTRRSIVLLTGLVALIVFAGGAFIYDRYGGNSAQPVAAAQGNALVRAHSPIIGPADA